MALPRSSTRVAAVRRFNRFYTQKIGVLGERLLGSEFSLTQVRILYELAQRGTCSATDLCRELGLDPGYVSRVLRDFARRRFVQRRRSDDDARVTRITLTPTGLHAFAPLDAAARRQVTELLRPLPAAQQQRLLDAMGTVTRVLDANEPHAARVSLRMHRPGDIGWVIHRHGVLYAQEYGWGAAFEALVGEIATRFLRELDPARERCWIAELGGEPVGSVFLVQAAPTVAQLRLLLVEPHARGHGIGERLVQACIDFARSCGYASLTLWTNDNLDAARKLYVAKGFRLSKEEPHTMWGTGLLAQQWELTL